ncbi:aspartate kinase [Cellulosilyticum sp. I15G10I2]|uniref:aspartate kinase n=1 Tax=Cellulosilyticum sp. I15G10I2 TaxID=1892843 RepID=UPI00085BE49B|nr:aspartate kinase [Cellulosilyticum sp. I15G10I2]
MNIIVQKFGGTSVATDESRERVVGKVIAAKTARDFPVVVVSAIGRKGSPYATDTLLDFVTSHVGSIMDREYDLLLSCGEIIAAVVIATLLTNKGYKAKALTGGQAGIITDTHHKNADLLYTHPDPILACIEQNTIPVIAGFQGMSKDGEITTLGRGGSDTTAALLAAGLKASRIEIYTDVDGIMTADPRVCDKAKIIPAISYNEVFQMADSGAKVIHPRAVEYAMRSNIPLIIKNTFTDEVGTCITQMAKIVNGKNNHHLITSIAHRSDRVQFTIQDIEVDDQHLLDLIATQNISIDLINIFPQYKVFTVDRQHQAALETLLKNSHHQYTLLEDCAKVTVIGERMTGVPGVMARIVKALQKAHIEILQTADSLTTIGCLIRQDNVSRAVSALHDEFLL